MVKADKLFRFTWLKSKFNKAEHVAQRLRVFHYDLASITDRKMISKCSVRLPDPFYTWQFHCRIIKGGFFIFLFFLSGVRMSFHHTTTIKTTAILLKDGYDLYGGDDLKHVLDRADVKTSKGKPVTGFPTLVLCVQGLSILTDDKHI